MYLSHAGSVCDFDVPDTDSILKEELPEKTAVSSGFEAERVRFELTMPSRTYRFSRPATDRQNRR